MPDTLTTNSPIIAGYRAATPGSAAASEKASRLFPSGVTHDSRYIEPYGLYITRAQGPRKWDVDGNCYVDYFGGHGALAARPLPSEGRGGGQPADRSAAPISAPRTRPRSPGPSG